MDYMSEMESEVLSRLQERLSNTPIEVVKEYRGVFQDFRVYCPDIVLKKGREVIAFIEVKSEAAFRAHPNYRTWLKEYVDKLPEENASTLFVITDGTRFLFNYLNIVEIVTDFEIFISTVLGGFTPYTGVRTCKYRNALLEQIKECSISNQDILKWLDGLDSAGVFEENGVSVRFSSEELENQFFLNLVGRVSDKHLCRYTTLNNLFSILDKQEQNMCCLVCMNDKGELSYVDDKLSTPYVTVPDDPNNCFILSLLPVSHEDELTFWRLYGCDAAGVCITYEVSKELNEGRVPGFYLAKVSYELKDGTHPALDLIRMLVNHSVSSGMVFTFRNWHIWKHFFKSKHFAIEDEVRLLYIPPRDNKADVKWIKNESNLIVSKMLLFDLRAKPSPKMLFPMPINHVFVGPRITDPQVIEQYDYMSKSNFDRVIPVKPSIIQNIYR